MKIKNLKWIALLAMAGIAISTQTAKAASNTFASGDLVFAVEDTNTTDANHGVTYLVDLGSPTTPTGISSLGSNLAALFGSNWYTNTNLDWGIYGFTTVKQGLNTNFTTYATQAESIYGTQNSGFTGLVQGNLNSAGSQMKAATADASANGSDGTVVNQVGTFNSSLGIAEQAGDLNSFASTNPPAQPNSFGTFNPSILGVGFSGTALDLFQDVGTGNTYEGTFTVDSSGDVVFSLAPPSLATPEAGSAFALMAIGLGCMVSMRRRLAVKTA